MAVDPRKMQKLYPSARSVRDEELPRQRVPLAEKDRSSRIILGLLGGLITVVCFALSCMSVFFYDANGNYIGGISFLSVGIFSLVLTIVVVFFWDFLEDAWDGLTGKGRK